MSNEPMSKTENRVWALVAIVVATAAIIIAMIVINTNNHAADQRQRQDDQHSQDVQRAYDRCVTASGWVC